MHVFPLSTLFLPSPLPPPLSPLPCNLGISWISTQEPRVVAEQGFIYLKDYLLIFVLISIFNF